MRNPKGMTKQGIVLNILKEAEGEFVSVWKLMEASNSVCVGAICSKLREDGHNIINESVPARNSQGMFVIHSSYRIPIQ